MAEYSIDDYAEIELSKHSYSAAKENVKGMQLDNLGKHKEACKHYKSAYMLSNAVYRMLKGEINLLELKCIGKSLVKGEKSD